MDVGKVTVKEKPSLELKRNEWNNPDSGKELHMGDGMNGRDYT